MTLVASASLENRHRVYALRDIVDDGARTQDWCRYSYVGRENTFCRSRLMTRDVTAVASLVPRAQHRWQFCGIPIPIRRLLVARGSCCLKAGARAVRAMARRKDFQLFLALSS
jgi:hypothetical protein